MFSQTTEYALRAAVCLASRPDESQTVQQLARLTQVPAGYLSKVMQALSRAGVVRSQRGLHGGFTLAVPADRLTVLDVVQAVDPIQRIRSCPLGLKGHLNLCPLHRRLDKAIALVEEALRSTSLSELLMEARPGTGVPLPLCPS